MESENFGEAEQITNTPANVYLQKEEDSNHVSRQTNVSHQDYGREDKT